MIKYDNIAFRGRIAGLACVLLLLSLIGQLYWLQISRHGELLAKAREKYTAVARKQGERGRIFDRHGNLLVGNQPCFDIQVDPSILNSFGYTRQVAEFFAVNLDLPLDLLEKRLGVAERLVDGVAVPNRYAPIADGIDLHIANNLRGEISARGWRGITFTARTRRHYPKNELLANVLGFTNLESGEAVPVMGVEKAVQESVAPTGGARVYERGRRGAVLSYGVSDIEPARDGTDVYLTISEPIQAIVEEELDALVEKWNPMAAYAVMVDPHTGDIIAMAQRPTYNPNDRSTMRPEAWRNRLIEDTFEPGSIMKPVAIAGALDYGLIEPTTLFDCGPGIWYYGGRSLRDTRPHGEIDVTEIVAKSSNIGTAKIALLMGEGRLYQTLRRFGFGQRTGVGLSPETVGIFRPLPRWDTLSITRFPIGQGIAVSPMQMARAYCALANGGRLVDLRLVDRIGGGADSKVAPERVSPSPGRKVFFRDTTARRIVAMMRRVTEDGGTATRASIPGYPVAGKTGTSQKWVDGAYSHSHYLASFIGFVPADEPAFVLLVVADEPQGAHYGGVVTAPTFNNIAAKTLRLMNIRPRQEIAGAGY